MEDDLKRNSNSSEFTRDEEKGHTTSVVRNGFKDTTFLSSAEKEESNILKENDNNSHTPMNSTMNSNPDRTMSLPKENTPNHASERSPKHNKEGSESQPPLPDEPVPEEYQRRSQTESESQPPLPDEPVPEEYQHRSQTKSESQPPLPDEPVPEEYQHRSQTKSESQPPLPDEPVPEEYQHRSQTKSESQPPLPDEPIPEEYKESVVNDSGLPATSSTEACTPQPSIAWSNDQQVAAIWDTNAQAYYFWDRRTNTTSWENPLEENDSEDESSSKYAARVQFNRLSGKYMPEWATPEIKSEEYKAYKHMEQFFDVDAAMSSTQGKSLLEERKNKRYTRKQMEEMKKKKKEKKEQKRRAMFDIASDDKDFRRRKIIRY